MLAKRYLLNERQYNTANGWIIFCFNSQNCQTIFSSTHQYFASKDEKHFSSHMWTMCFLNKETFRCNLGINIKLNGQIFQIKGRTMFCYDLSQPAADNILPQRVNVLPQCLYDFYEYILPAKKFEFFNCFSLFCLNSI